MKQTIYRIKMWYWKIFNPSRYKLEVTKERLQDVFARATENLIAFAKEIGSCSASVKIDLPAQKDIPQIARGDIVRVESCHSANPHFYEVSEIRSDGVVSQPACFHHRYNEITAVYRYDGKHFGCIWEG